MNLDSTLYKYLITTGSLPLPGLGTLRVNQQSATYDIAGKQFLPPTYHFSLDPEEKQSPGQVFEWLSTSLGIGDGEAIESLNSFANRFKHELGQSRKSIWEGVGAFKKDLAGVLSFQSEEITPLGLAPVQAEKVIHAHASHTMLVGDQEKTSEEMTAWLEGESTPRNWPMILAWVLLGLSLLFLGYHFSKKGLNASAFGNEQTIEVNP
ncbi:MAG: hypothetical protein SFU20_07090 [Chitinophagaceae bacterium]|nr:hypothetical protein [Chitinophagaceae bacterium]